MCKRLSGADARSQRRCGAVTGVATGKSLAAAEVSGVS